MLKGAAGAMPRSLQDVLRAGAERSRANAPREIQTRLEREEEIREENRRIRYAKDLPEMGRNVKHAWNRLWEETKNEADMKQNARDCYAEREDLWKQVEAMDAIRETSHIYERIYNELLERHEQIMNRLKDSLEVEKMKERLFIRNADEARADGDLEAAEDQDMRLAKVRNEIQWYDYVMYGAARRMTEDEALARGIAASDLQDV